MIRAATQWEIGFISKVLNYRPTDGVKSIVDMEGETLQSAVMFDHWTHNACQIHVWAPKQLRRSFLREIFSYVFETAGRGIVLAINPETMSSIETAKRAGFVEIYRIKDGWQVGEDMVIQELRRENCIWIQKRAA